MTIFNKLKKLFGGEEVISTPSSIITAQSCESKSKPCVKCEEKKHIRPYLDENIYNFASKMQEVIKTKKVASSNYTTQDLEKIDEDIATINAQYTEGQEFAEFDVKAAARLFLLNNQLSS